MKNFGYTLVQHSGFAWAGHDNFSNGIEVIGLSNKAEVKQVKDSGGIVFDKWIDADDFSMDVMYPDNYNGIIPKARGGFGPLIRGLRIYVLAADDWNMLAAA